MPISIYMAGRTDTKFDASGIWQVECLINPDDATEVEEQLSGCLKDGRHN